MNKNKRLATLSLITLALISLSACVATNPSSTASAGNTVVSTPSQKGHSLKVINSKGVVLSNVKVEKEGSIHEVEGTVKLNVTQRRVLGLPGYITVTVKDLNGKEIEQVKAKYHRKYGASKIGHFDAKLMQQIPNGSYIIIQHHR